MLTKGVLRIFFVLSKRPFHRVNETYDDRLRQGLFPGAFSRCIVFTQGLGWPRQRASNKKVRLFVLESSVEAKVCVDTMLHLIAKDSYANSYYDRY